MELKWERLGCVILMKKCSNRTFMELKLSFMIKSIIAFEF